MSERGVRGLSAGERVALVISECQQAMTLDEYRGVRDELARNFDAAGVAGAIAALAAEFRELGHPVVHSWLVPRAGWQAFSVNCTLAGVLKRTDLLREDLPGSQPHPELQPEPGDLVVARHTGMTSFEGTDLDAQLRAMKVETVVVVGVSVNVAVHGTMLEAVNRGYNVVVPTDCVAGIGRTAQVMLEDIYPLLSTVTDRAAVVETLRSR